MTVASEYLLETLKSFRGMKSNVERALEQLDDELLHRSPDANSNSIVIIMQHMSGNMLSRFTDFLTTDGEKPSRDRDTEFEDHTLLRNELMDQWENGWKCVFDAIGSLTDNDLLKIVKIRNEDHTVLRALNRQLVHYAYHCGQIVYLAKHLKGENFVSLSIPKGKSREFNQTPPSLRGKN